MYDGHVGSVSRGLTAQAASRLGRAQVQRDSLQRHDSSRNGRYKAAEVMDMQPARHLSMLVPSASCTNLPRS